MCFLHQIPCKAKSQICVNHLSKGLLLMANEIVIDETTNQNEDLSIQIKHELTEIKSQQRF